VKKTKKVKIINKLFLLLVVIIGILLVPAGVQAATLFLSPVSGSYTVGDSFSVGVYVNSDGQAINSAQATLSFPNDILQVTGVSSSGIFTMWIPTEPTYSNNSGTVSFSGGVPNGYTGAAGSIITISFQAKVAGTASVTIGSASVLANDGFGTNVLTGLGNGSYTVTVAEPEPEPEPELELPNAPTITSPTHGEQSLWYPHADSTFEWNQQSGVVGFSYEFDDESDTTPDQIRDTTDTTVSFTGTDDGVWYFHARAQNQDGWGPVGHYKVQIDTIPPLSFDINLVDGQRTQNKTPRISFETTDETSGVHHYDVVVNSGTAVSVDVGKTTPYTLSELEEGKHSVTAFAYDNAGNSVSSFTSFTIGPPAETVVPGEGDEAIKEVEVPAVVTLIDNIADALPKPIQKITEAIGDTVQVLRDNETISNIVDKIIEPSMTIAAVIVATGVAASAITAFHVTNLVYLFFRFSYLWLAPVAFGKRRKRSWGTVFDSVTGRPIRRAIVRIFLREFNKLVESQITDAQGRFGFLVDPGEYFVTVTRPGFVFPSHIMQTSAVSQYEDIYRGDTIKINERNAGSLALNIPIDPNIKEVPRARLRWLRFLNKLGYLLEKFSVPFLTTGTVLSWFALIVDPATVNYCVLGLYAVLIFTKYLVGGILERSWGEVTDSQSGDPIGMAAVRVYNAGKGNIVGTRVTNSKGQFTALVSPGQYYLVVVKAGYQVFKSKLMTVTKRQGLIKIKIQLKPLTIAPEPEKEKKKETIINLEAVEESASAVAQGREKVQEQEAQAETPEAGKDESEKVEESKETPKKKQKTKLKKHPRKKKQE